MITKETRRGHVGKGSANVKRIAQIHKAKAPVDLSALLLAEKPILRTLRRVRKKGRIERVFG